MKTANGGTAPTYSNPNIVPTTENDYSSFANSGSPANAIVVFSNARITSERQRLLWRRCGERR